MTVPAGRRVFLVNVADLLRRPGSSRAVAFDAAVSGLVVVDSAVPDGAEAHVELRLESLNDGVTVTGTISAPWVGSCRRCLDAAAGTLHASVTEVYSPHPASDEIWPLAGDQLDLFPLVTEALTLELPLAPLCRADCAGLCPTCGADRNRGDCGHRAAPGDRRWAALEGLAGPEEP